MDEAIPRIRRSNRAQLRSTAGFILSDAISALVRSRLPIGSHFSDTVDPQHLIVVTSFFSKQDGISAGADAQIAALEELGLSCQRVDATPAIRNPFASAGDSIADVIGSVLVHTDGRRVSIPLHYLRKGLARAFRVGYCAWELPTPPADWRRFDEVLNEVWVPSEFSKSSLERMCQRPVRVVRHVVLPTAEHVGKDFRAQLSVHSHDFMVLAMADVRSSLARKNPMGVILAFKKALGHCKDAVLVLKMSGADHDPPVFEALRRAAGNARVVLITRRLGIDEKWSLYRSCDVFMSLHRAEGYDLPMAEAMAVGRPVIATAWSGNLDFMNHTNSALVDFDLSTIRDPQGIYKTGYWAEPRLDHAVHWLARLYDDRPLRTHLGSSARTSMAYPLQLAQFRSQLPSADVAAG